MAERTFEITPAQRAEVPVLVGLFGPSGSGKTYSALRLATGIQKVYGGDIFVIDTEARRALHYADMFKFKHLPFGAPFSPNDYLQAIRACLKAGAKTIIVDSMSHEHEGTGGVLEMQDAEWKRMGGKDGQKFAAWIKPKAERTKLIQAILQMQANFVFCFRAKEKIKIAQKGSDEREKVKQLGFMPIAGEEYVYEMTVNCLLLPGSKGMPSWHPEEMGEKAMIKLPRQFETIFSEQKPLDEDIGQKLALWAMGGAKDSAIAEAERLAAEAAVALKTQKTMLQDAVLAKVKGDVDKAKALLADIAPGITSFRELTTLDAIMAAGDKLKIHPEYGDANKREEAVA